jgi:cyclophilin family peptidyl-prolyl cis-trans isomerase
MQELEPRMLLSAVLTEAIPTLYIPSSGGTAVVDLTNYFDDDEIDGTVVRYDTVYGEFDVQLFDNDTPATVQNYLGYVDRGDYDGTFIHRNALLEDDTPFVVQGGGFKYTAPNNYNAITQKPSVLNEPGISNTRGTIAMAKLGGDPDSATNQWFFNMGDNSANLDNQNGGFTVFGEVLGDGMDIVDQIAATPNWDASSLNGAFDSLPLRDFTNDHFPNNDDLVVINSIQRVEELSYRVVSTSQPTRVAAIVDENGQLKVFTIGVNGPQSVTITVEAEDHDGNTQQATFTVELGAAKDSLDNDRLADLIWRNFATGKNTVWEMIGISVDQATPFDQVNANTWYIAATGDFDHDGNNDLLWRNAFDGQNKVWLMDETSLLSVVDLQTVANRDWSIGGVADFNNDGNLDILWRNARKGTNVVWTMEGTTEIADSRMRLPKQTGSEWYIGGVGDFDRDGAADIMWRNNDGGQNKVWLLNTYDGTLKQSVALLSQGNANWVATGVADYNADNQMDILWRNIGNGKQMVWTMNGTNRGNVFTNIKALRNQDWQLPGRTSQLAAEGNAIAKLQRQKNKSAKTANAVSASASAIAASAQAAQASVSLLSEVEPIIDLEFDDPSLDV